MSFGDRLLGTIPWLLATIMIAGIVHISSILAMPRLASEDAYSRVSRIAPPNTWTLLLQKPESGIVLPFEDPATTIAVCRFDLTAGPLRLKGKLSGDGLTLLSFRNRYGAAFYAMNDRGTSRGDLNVIVVTQKQLEALEANDPEEELPSELRLVAPTLQGFVMLRALAPEKSQRQAAVQSLKAINCTLEKLQDDTAQSAIR